MKDMKNGITVSDIRIGKRCYEMSFAKFKFELGIGSINLIQIYFLKSLHGIRAMAQL